MKETKQGPADAASRAVMHGMMEAFEAFKSENDQRMKKLEKKQTDPLFDEKLSRINASIDDLMSKADRLAAEARRPRRGVEGGDSPQVSEQKAAFASYMKTGQTAGLEFKDVTGTVIDSTNTYTGGWLAPPEVERAITLRVTHSSPMRSICQVQTISAPLYRKVIATTTLAASWAAETAARVATTPATLINLDVPSVDLYAVPAASQNMLNDALVNMDEWLAAECEDAFAFQETQAFITGTGVNQPSGLLNAPIAADSASLPWGTLGYIASGGIGAITSADPVMDLIYAPRPNFRANGKFIFSRKTTAMLRKLKDTYGHYIWEPPTEAGKPASLFGYPVVEVETMPDPPQVPAVAPATTPTQGTGNPYCMAFGDFERGYLIVDRAGVTVLRDPYTAKPYVLFYTTKRVGGAVQRADAIKLLKFAAT